MGVRWSTPRLGRFTLGKDAVPIEQEAEGTEGRSGWVRTISPSSGFDPQTVRPVASRYTDYAIPAHLVRILLCIIPEHVSACVINHYWSYVQHLQKECQRTAQYFLYGIDTSLLVSCWESRNNKTLKQSKMYNK